MTASPGSAEPGADGGPGAATSGPGGSGPAAPAVPSPAADGSDDDAASGRALRITDVFRRVADLDPSAGRRLAGVAALSFVGGMLEAGLLVVLARIALTVANGEHGLEVVPGWRVSIRSALVLTTAALFVKLVINTMGARLAASTATEVLGATRFALLRGFFRSTWARQSTERTGELQELMTTHVDRTTSVVLALASLVTAALSVATLVVASLVVNRLAAGAIAVAGLALSALLRPVSGMARRNGAIQTAAGRTFAGAVSEAVDMAREVRTFGVSEQVLRRLRRLHEAQAEKYERSRFLLLLAPQLYQSAALLVLITGIALLGLRGVSSLDEVGPVVLLLLRALSYGQQAQSNYHQLNDLAPYIDELRRQRDRYEGDAAGDGTRALAGVGEYEVDRVSFAYLPGSPVLDDVSFRVGAGETIGIIGPSGSGKSTLLQLLLGLRRPSTGALRLDGIDTGEFTLADWCRMVSFVPQDPRLFAGTVAENIAYYRSIDRAAIERAARLAHLHDEIAALPGGYDEPIGPGDRSLSGGQQQRLCIARALVTEPALLLLDEPTSALDMRSEARIQETLAGLRGTVTLVIVAHRMTTLAACDRILVLADGRVQGYDAHERLLTTSAFYEEALRLSTITGTAAGEVQ